MFAEVVFALLALLLTISTATALYLGLFRAGGDVGLGRKMIAGLVSGVAVLVIWGLLYSNHYLGW